MKKEYENLFKELVKSYYNGNFDDTLKNILKKDNINKTNLQSIISALCGVDIKNDNNYIYNIKKAITNYKVKKNIVKKIDKCDMSCADENGITKCQSICPIDAIISENDDIKIDNDLCINCGRCVEVCDDNKLLDKVEFIPLLDLIKNNKNVVAVVAPAISGQWGNEVTLDMLREAFIKIGFTDMLEVAFAADMLTIKEAVEFNNHVKTEDDLMITSCCCPMWVGMLRKVYKKLVKDVSPSISPMIAMGRVIKKIKPDVKVVFVGPCIAKKAEAKDKDLVGAIDYVLTFQEVKTIFDSLSINPKTLKGIPTKEYASRGGRLYARTGGVSIAISEAVEELFPEKHKMLKAIQANGVKECKEILAKAEKGEINANFIEGMGCIGGCVGGPKALVSKELGKEAVDKVAFSSPIKVATHSEGMDKVLKKIGITSLNDFKEEDTMGIFERNF
ncbi:[Fe-Fe] hydrogenase large subunit C-terminal domain-containing protein [Clostridium fallax]|uniref:Ferredoxin hydrogenase n=2 Tax=Clostridium fallax TaxID=1533 RepID=A0A1M4YZ02_9CLOT|nr:[Fe-Fe] hydrogenase large subunit C-terminal domain-containing protein [Clostridium fallax]SHF11039.1 ferredoxin hydrogenase [Clostridium fallax]SQB07376.1 iron only hydrogenase large subunit, C-terminal domain protein [Clostridium fallax]